VQYPSAIAMILLTWRDCSLTGLSDPISHASHGRKIPNWAMPSQRASVSHFPTNTRGPLRVRSDKTQCQTKPATDAGKISHKKAVAGSRTPQPRLSRFSGHAKSGVIDNLRKILLIDEWGMARKRRTLIAPCSKGGCCRQQKRLTHNFLATAKQIMRAANGRDEPRRLPKI